MMGTPKGNSDTESNIVSVLFTGFGFARIRGLFFLR